MAYRVQECDNCTENGYKLTSSISVSYTNSTPQGRVYGHRSTVIYTKPSTTILGYAWRNHKHETHRHDYSPRLVPGANAALSWEGKSTCMFIEHAYLSIVYMS